MGQYRKKEPYGKLRLVSGEEHAIAFKGTPYEKGFYVDELGYCFRLDDKTKQLACNIHTRTQLKFYKRRDRDSEDLFCINCSRDGYDQ